MTVTLDDIKLIVSDVDGTLLTKKHTLHPTTTDAIRAVRAAKPNVPIIIATGRQRNSCDFIRKAFGIDGLYETIHMHGAVLYDPPGVILHQITPPLSTLQQAMTMAEEAKMTYFIYTHDRVYICQDKADRFDWLPWVAAFGEYAEKPPADYKAQVASGAIQIVKLAFAQAEGQLEHIQPHITALPGVVVTKALRETFEMVAEGVDKSVALAKVLERYNIDASGVAAFGDGANDVGMLKMAGYSVAMANGMTAPKEVAKYHTTSNDEGGVGVWLQSVLAKQ